MPEFIMNAQGRITLGQNPIGTGRQSYEPMTWRDLDEFTQGYIEAMFFTESDPSVTMAEFMADTSHEFIDGSIPSDSSFGDLSPEALRKIIADCREFQAINRKALESVYGADWNGSSKWGEYDSSMAGRDFWFTRNGHGVGFWDRGLGEAGAILSESCGYRTRFYDVNPYVSDSGKIEIG